MTKYVSVLGSTGVIGTRTLAVLKHLGQDYRVKALAGGKNAELLAQQITDVQPVYVAVADDETRQRLQSLLETSAYLPDIGVGESGLVEAASLESDVVVTGIVGSRGLLPTWAAISRGAVIALANKETLVAAGDLVMPHASRHGVPIIPVDSEHSALFQCLRAGSVKETRRLILTASGGPFRTWDKEAILHAEVEQALRHPNWSMGRKITVDSASLMNKGLEVIEAHHLFGVDYDRIDVLVHPQSVIHSMVEYQDGTVMAQLGAPDMNIPIQYALTHPDRTPSPWPTLDFDKLATLTFEGPDVNRFPSLTYAYDAGRAGGYAPCVLNAVNEVAVEAFLAREIEFGDIFRIVEKMLQTVPVGMPSTIADIIEVDESSRVSARRLLTKG